MTIFSYIAVDPKGAETRGTIEVTDQFEAIGRIKQMGLYPTRILEGTANSKPRFGRTATKPRVVPAASGARFFVRRIKPSVLAAFTRQLATLVEAGLPLLRGLRILEEQEENPRLKCVVGDLGLSIEGGSSFAESLIAHPKVFSKLYVNMVRAGEIGGALDISLKRLAEFMEKALRIKGKITAAMFYPGAVLVVAFGILILLMGFIVPRFKSVFEGLTGAPLPAFTLFVLNISQAVQHHIVQIMICAGSFVLAVALAKRTEVGSWVLDQLKLGSPVIGPLFRKAAISRFTRTLGTLLGNGVPVLQALVIVRETAANSVYARLIGRVHENVKGGDPIAPTLKASGLFPSMVAGMVDVGEQTGALPEMLLKVADTYDEQVDNAATALTSLLEPIMIVFLAVVVGSIVIAMFLPIIQATSIGEPTVAAGTAE